MGPSSVTDVSAFSHVPTPVFSVVGYIGEVVGKKTADLEGKSGTFLEQIFSSIRVVQAFAAEKTLVSKYDAYLKTV